MATIATWNDVTRAAPELALAVQRSFDAHIHKALATLRADGLAPDQRPGSVVPRRRSLARHDARLAQGEGPPARPEVGVAQCHGRPRDGGGRCEALRPGRRVTDQETFEWFIGEERAEKGQEPPEPFHLFRVDIDEIVLTTLGGDPPDHLVIETWRERRGTTRVECC